MNLKNYTSQVPASKSISKIEKLLVGVGAKNINKSYEGETLKAIIFLVSLNENTLAFRLPAKVEVVEKVLRAEVKRPRPDTFSRIAKQAERTAWKIVCDWVEIQVAMIKLEQAELAEVFLPYYYYAEQDMTLFERIENGQIKLFFS